MTVSVQLVVQDDHSTFCRIDDIVRTALKEWGLRLKQKDPQNITYSDTYVDLIPVSRCGMGAVPRWDGILDRRSSLERQTRGCKTLGARKRDLWNCNRESGRF